MMSLEERVARIEGILEQMDKRFSEFREYIEKRFDQINERINRLENEVSHLREEMGEIRKDMSTQFRWIIGIMITMWITIIITILFK